MSFDYVFNELKRVYWLRASNKKFANAWHNANQVWVNGGTRHIDSNPGAILGMWELCKNFFNPSIDKQDIFGEHFPSRLHIEVCIIG